MSRSRFAPVPGLVSLVMIGGVAVLTAFASWPVSRWAYADWVAVSATGREALVYAGPWAGAWSSWTAGRYLGSRSIVCPPSASRAGWSIVGHQFGRLAAAATIGHTIGLAPLVVVTARRATAGSFDLVVVAGGMAVLVALCALGYLIGALVPRWLGPLAAFVVGFAMVLLVDWWGLVLAPIWLQTPAAGDVETRVVAVFRLAFYAAAAAALAGAATRLLADRTSVPRVGNYTGLLVLTVPVIVGYVARATAPEPIVPEAQPPISCGAVGAVDVCVHRAKAELLQPLSQVVSSVLEVVDHRPAVDLKAVVDASVLSSPGSGVVRLDLQTRNANWREWAAGDIAAVISGFPACERSGDAFGGEVTTRRDRAGVSLAFAIRIARAAGYTPPHLLADSQATPTDPDVHQLDEQGFRAAYRDFADRLARCDLPSSDLS